MQKLNEPRYCISLLFYQVYPPILQITLDRGCINDMKSLPIDCSLCQWSGVMKDYPVIIFSSLADCGMIFFLSSKAHLDQSHSHPQCEYCDQQFRSVNQYNEHKLSECPRITVACLLKDHGCSDSVCYLLVPSNTNNDRYCLDNAW